MRGTKNIDGSMREKRERSKLQGFIGVYAKNDAKNNTLSEEMEGRACWT